MLTNHSCCADRGPWHFAAVEVTSGDWQWPARRSEVSPDLVLQRLRVKA